MLMIKKGSDSLIISCNAWYITSNTWTLLIITSHPACLAEASHNTGKQQFPSVNSYKQQKFKGQ